MEPERTGRRIDILIPTRGRPDDLRIALSSLQAMRGYESDTRILVIDNAEDPEESRRVADQVEGDVPVTVLHNRKPGKGTALNHGIENSSAEYVVMIDDDVEVADDFLSNFEEAIERWPDAEVFGGNVHIRWPDVSSADVEKSVLEYVKPYAYGRHDWIETERPYRDQEHPIGSNMVFRRSLLARFEGFPAEMGPAPGRYRMGGEYEVWRRCIEEEVQMVHVPSASLDHRIRQEQVTSRWILERSFSWGRSVGCYGLSYRDIHAEDGWSRLIGLWLRTFLIEAAMIVKRKPGPRMWARVDRATLNGVLYERLLRLTDRRAAE